MDTDDALDLVAGERKDTRHDPGRTPAKAPSGLPRHPFVPADLSLEGTEIVEPRLDLHDEQRPSPPVERKEIDPTM